MAIKTIYIMTGNPDKLRVAQNIFSQYDINVEAMDLDIPEIQAKTSAEVAHYAVRAAYDLHNKSFVREDHSFYIDELGIPGPFMSYMDKTVPVETLVRIVDLLPSRKAHFELAAAYVDSDGEIFDISYQVPIEIADTARGDESLRWERAMMFPGESVTFAEQDDNRDDVWSANYHKIAQHIVDSNK